MTSPNRTMIRPVRSAAISDLAAALEAVDRAPETRGLMILACGANAYAPDDVRSVMRKLRHPVCGGLFPRVLFEGLVHEVGAVVVGMTSAPRVRQLTGLDGERRDHEQALAAAFPAAVAGAGSMLVFVDGTGTRVNSALQAIYGRFGGRVTYVGGGAGKLDMQRTPCIFTNDGLVSNVAQLVLIDRELGVGVRHGMRSVSGPHRITEARGNTLVSIDWQPAIEFYRKHLDGHPDHMPESRGFCGTDFHFSLGVTRLGAERIVLEPTSLAPAGGINVIPEVHEGGFVDIVRMTADSLATSANEARCDAIERLITGAHELTLCFSCISRQLFFGARFEEEIATLEQDGVPVIGALTIGGEIGSDGDAEYLEYYNRTCVVGVGEGL